MAAYLLSRKNTECIGQTRSRECCERRLLVVKLSPDMYHDFRVADGATPAAKPSEKVTVADASIHVAEIHANRVIFALISPSPIFFRDNRCASCFEFQGFETG